MGNLTVTLQNACVGERERAGAEPLAGAHMNEKLEDATPEAADTTLVQKEAKRVERTKKHDPCRTCCWTFFCAAGVFCVAAVITVIVLTTVFMVCTRSPCSVERLEDWKGWVNSSVVLGTHQNTANFSVDLNGVWWKRWKRSGGWTPRFYDVAKLGIGLSFGGLAYNSSTFPAKVTVPVNQPGGRLFSDSFWSRLFLPYSASIDPKEPLVIVFENKSYGRVIEEKRVAWTMGRIGEDRWHVSDGGHKEYELTRIVTEDGEQHPIFWGYFMEHLGPSAARVFRFNDTCRRTCGVYRSSCETCEKSCKEKTS